VQSPVQVLITLNIVLQQVEIGQESPPTCFSQLPPLRDVKALFLKSESPLKSYPFFVSSVSVIGQITTNQPYITCNSLSFLKLQEHSTTTQCRNPVDCSHLKSSLCEDVKAISLWSCVPCSHCFMKWDL
jgi:hypothetical protein